MTFSSKTMKLFLRSRSMKLRLFFKELYLQYMTLALGLFSLANAYQLIGINFLRYFASIFAVIILMIFFIRILLLPRQFLLEIQNIFMMTPYQTGIMALYFVSQVIESFTHSKGAYILWGIALSLNILLLMNFCVTLLKEKIVFSDVSPTWYLMFLGIAVGGLTGYQMGLLLIAKWITGYVVAGFILITPLIVARLLAGERFLDNLQPLKGVMCAAPALLLVVLSVIYPRSSKLFSVALLLMSQGFLVWIYSRAKMFIKNYFCINYCSLTFPLGISCTALFIFRDQYIDKESLLFEATGWLFYCELWVATLVIPIIILAYFLQTYRLREML